jgi:hypothetical protein
MEPQIGEIWRDNRKDRHYLIVDIENDPTMLERNISMLRYSILRLDNGTIDGAWIQFFDTYCQKVC